MAQTYIQPGDVMEYVNTTGSAIASGAVVIIGSLAGIALVDIPDTKSGSVMIEGVHKLDKTTSLVITQGDELFWNTGTGKVTKTATDKPIGTAHESQLSADTTVLVKLYGRGNAVATAAVVAQLAGTLTGTVDGTIADVPDATAASTDASAASLASVNASITAINLQLKELQTSLNAALTALKNAGLMASA